MQLRYGAEYKDTEIDFLTKLPWRETRVTYLGKHPYDQRHMFASEQGGVLLVPDDGKMLERLVPLSTGQES